MKPDIKQKWVDALRSGEFKQGRNALRQIVDGQPLDCCLGVLCELHRREHPERFKWVQDHQQCHLFNPEDSTSTYSFLPHAVCVWAGLDPFQEADPHLGSDTASEHNDSGRTFEEIAKLIEESL